MQKKTVLSLCCVLFSVFAYTQPSFEFTTFQSRRQHDRYLIDTVIRQGLAQPLASSSEYRWKSAFWAMELMLYKTSFTKEKVAEAWHKGSQTSEGFQKALLEVSYTLYPTAFDKAVLQLLNVTSSPAVFIRCAEYLLLSKNRASHKSKIERALRRFASNDFTGLALLGERLNPKAQKLPPLKDIFSKSFLPGQTVIYSLQRRNRNHPGLVIIRKPDGSFVRNTDGSFFHSAQLARAITNYPFYVTNGNTPEGIFRWTGFDTSSVDYIGPTANLQMVMPYEAKASVFFGDSVSAFATWSKELYASLLPSSWKEYNGIYQSFYAGQIGRTEIIMHGTTINPAYYKGQTYFPQTPSLGCLCSYEEWNANGRRIRSNQQKIVEALQSIGATNGYVMVIDLNDNQKTVELDEILSFVTK